LEGEARRKIEPRHDHQHKSALHAQRTKQRPAQGLAIVPLGWPEIEILAQDIFNQMIRNDKADASIG